MDIDRIAPGLERIIDVNGTLEDERIQHMAGTSTPAGVAREQLFRMIRDAGKVPVERDALYNVVPV